MINAGRVLDSVSFFAIQSMYPKRTANKSYKARAAIRIIAVQGVIRRPNTAPRLTMARIITKLCNQTLGIKNHASPTIMAIISAMTNGNQKISIINVPQENKKAKRNLKSNRKAEIGTRERIIPITTTKTKKYIIMGPREPTAGAGTSPGGAGSVGCGHSDMDSGDCSGI